MGMPMRITLADTEIDFDRMTDPLRGRNPAIDTSEPWHSARSA